MVGRSNYAQAEMDRLASQYAKLLGHQNQKQKIHHVAKIKEENINLKKVWIKDMTQVYTGDSQWLKIPCIEIISQSRLVLTSI